MNSGPRKKQNECTSEKKKYLKYTLPHTDTTTDRLICMHNHYRVIEYAVWASLPIPQPVLPLCSVLTQGAKADWD